MNARAITNCYRVAIAMILSGFVMLCQPLFETLFTYGFPVLLAGVVLFMILDHVPEKTPTEEG